MVLVFRASRFSCFSGVQGVWVLGGFFEFREFRALILGSARQKPHKM